MRSGATLRRTGDRRRGDSFTAALVAGLLSGLPLATIDGWGIRVAPFASSQPRATPLLPDYLGQPLRRSSSRNCTHIPERKSGEGGRLLCLRLLAALGDGRINVR
jgi:hypothetical protein